MGRVVPKMSGSGEVMWYANPPAKVFLVVLPIAVVLGSLIGLPYFLHVYGPDALICLGVPVIVTTWLFLLLVNSRFLILTVGIGRSYVILKYLFRTRRVDANSVEEISLKPSIESDSLEYRYWGVPDSVCRIKLTNGSIVQVSLMPNGVKLRMARVLDPENFPS